MRLLFRLAEAALLVFTTLVAPGSSASTVYVTDLPIYSALAPCAAEAVSYVVQQLTESICPASVTALESCACTQDQNSAAVSSSIVTHVSFYCGSTAAEDVTSAGAVFGAYCNQATPVTVPTATAGAVSQYITNLPAFSDLGYCARDALSYVVMELTESKCPGGQSALESCACTKDQNSLAVSESINSQVAIYCSSTASEDITSAQGVFAGYCGLAAGTSSFPTFSALAGDVTYYITDLPIYSSMAECARYAVAYPVQAQTVGDCPSDPMQLVSCVCVKDQNSLAMSSSIVKQVSEGCGSTASADVTSALAVFDYYCSAGKGLVTPAGVTASVIATKAGGAAATTKAGGGAAATATNTGSSSGSSGGTGSSSSSGGSVPGTINGVPVAAIAGGAGGGTLFIIFMLFVAYKYNSRRKLARQNRPPPPVVDEDKPKPPPFTPGSKFQKPEPTVAVSPVSPVDGTMGLAELLTPQERRRQELQDMGSRRTELNGFGTRPEFGYDSRFEAPGSIPQHPYEMSANMHDGPWEMHAP